MSTEWSSHDMVCNDCSIIDKFRNTFLKIMESHRYFGVDVYKADETGINWKSLPT